MIGRGSARDVTGTTLDGSLLYGDDHYVQLVGSRRLSTELGDIVERVNRDDKLGLHFDYAMDANGHPQEIYCRSDHYQYARYGIPIVFFTTGGHADYHQFTDEAQYIDYDNMPATSADEIVPEMGRFHASFESSVSNRFCPVPMLREPSMLFVVNSSTS